MLQGIKDHIINKCLAERKRRRLLRQDLGEICLTKQEKWELESWYRDKFEYVKPENLESLLEPLRHKIFGMEIR